MDILNAGALGPIGGNGHDPLGDGRPRAPILHSIAEEFAELSRLFDNLSRTTIGAARDAGQPVTGVDFTPQIDFKQQPQQRFNWCWLAVTASVKEYFESASTQQFDLANKLLHRHDCGTNQGEECDKGGSLGVALESLKHLAPATLAVKNPEERSMSFEEIAAEFDRTKMPFCIYIDWGLGGEGHFCVVSGSAQLGGEQYLYVHDPLFGDGPQPYSRVLSNYNLERGKWKYTYRLKA